MVCKKDNQLIFKNNHDKGGGEGSVILPLKVLVVLKTEPSS
jgi:hypothetical protein